MWAVFSAASKQAHGRHFDGGVAYADPQSVVLESDLKVHGAGGQSSERLTLRGGDLPDAQVVDSRHPVFHGGPPGGCGGAETVYGHFFRPAAEPYESFLFGQAEFDPK